MIQEWSSHYKEVDPAISKCWTLREYFSIEDGCIAYLGRLLIPPNLRKSCMDSLHKGHPGMSEMCLGQKDPVLARYKTRDQQQSRKIVYHVIL